MLGSFRRNRKRTVVSSARPDETTAVQAAPAKARHRSAYHLFGQNQRDKFKAHSNGTIRENALMSTSDKELTIDEYLRERPMPVEDAIPHSPRIETNGNSI